MLGLSHAPLEFQLVGLAVGYIYAHHPILAVVRNKRHADHGQAEALTAVTVVTVVTVVFVSRVCRRGNRG